MNTFRAGDFLVKRGGISPTPVIRVPGVERETFEQLHVRRKLLFVLHLLPLAFPDHFQSIPASLMSSRILMVLAYT